jgi:hypothetical protein
MTKKLYESGYGTAKDADKSNVAERDSLSG